MRTTEKKCDTMQGIPMDAGLFSRRPSGLNAASRHYSRGGKAANRMHWLGWTVVLTKDVKLYFVYLV